ncbi:MAG: hypothetical protein INR65_07030, partial [Gluconacetobacter diazotrophicus]|nr:hypothetical protein [Gluconacetobacter diazotrophicus]
AEADRHDETICRHFAGMLRRAKREDAAADAIAAFLDRNTGSPALLLEMAELDRARNRRTTATARVALARTLAPEEPAVRAAVLADLEERGQFPNLDFLGRTPTPAVSEQSVMIYHRSLALAAAGRPEEALAIAVIAVELSPNNPTIMQNLLGLMLRGGRPADARLLVGCLEAAGQATGEAVYVLSLAEAELGNAAAAARAAQRAAELAPENEVIVGHHRRMADGGAEDAAADGSVLAA